MQNVSLFCPRVGICKGIYKYNRDKKRLFSTLRPFEAMLYALIILLASSVGFVFFDFMFSGIFFTLRLAWNFLHFGEQAIIYCVAFVGDTKRVVCF